MEDLECFQLPAFLEHELKYKNFDSMRVVLEPYLSIAGALDLVAAVRRLSDVLSVASPDHEKILVEIASLERVIISRGWQRFSPKLLSQKVRVYSIRRSRIAFLFDNDLVGQALIQVLSEILPLVRSYSTNYHLNDIAKEGLFVITDSNAAEEYLGKAGAGKPVKIDLGNPIMVMPELVRVVEAVRGMTCERAGLAARTQHI